MAKSFSFIKIRYATFIISAMAIAVMFTLTFIPGVLSTRGGFNLGVDFEPGVSAVIAINPAVSVVHIEKIRPALISYPDAQIQSSGAVEKQEYMIRIRGYEEGVDYGAVVRKTLLAELNAAFGAESTTILSVNSVGPRFSASLTQQAFWLVLIALVCISIYVWIRFKFGYAMGAMVATIHDTVFLVGFIGVSQMEVTSATIAAVLTIIGYSLNDTIVVFDRIRENEKTMAGQPLAAIIDGSINQTMSRTLMTSLTTLLAVVAIAVFTTGEIQNFAIALIVGIVIGTYSSIFMASPVLLEWRTAQARARKRHEAKGGVAVQVATEDQKIDEVTEVDADAIADEIRRQRTDRKKF